LQAEKGGRKDIVVDELVCSGTIPFAECGVPLSLKNQNGGLLGLNRGGVV